MFPLQNLFPPHMISTSQLLYQQNSHTSLTASMASATPSTLPSFNVLLEEGQNHLRKGSQFALEQPQLQIEFRVLALHQAFTAYSEILSLQ
jgi:hypothetical protein